MANKKINQLVSKTAILSTDIFGIGDATTGQLFKKTIAELQAAIGGAVISVNGLVGTVVLDTDDIQELATPTNKYFTDARARGAISLTVTGNSGASTYSSGTGVLNVPTYTLAGLGGISATFLSGTSGISYNSTTGVISYSGTVYTDASIRALLSGSTGISYNSTTGAISYSGTVYTDASIRALISLTTTGDSGASTYNNTTGVINVPNYTLAGLGGISYTSLSGGTGITYNNTTGAISYSGTVYTDASVRALISATSPISYNNTTGVISLSGGNLTEATSSVLTITGGTGAVIGAGTSIQVKQASTTVSGFLSSTDFNTFNGKASALSGTTNYVAKFTSSTGIGNSLIHDNGSQVSFGTTTPTHLFEIYKNTTSTTAGVYPAINVDNANASGYSSLYFSQGGVAKAGFDYNNAAVRWDIFSASDMRFITNSTERLRISADGNLGFGVTPFTNTLSKGFDLVGGGGMFSIGSSFYIMSNAYYNTEWRYKATAGTAGIALNSDGSMTFSSAVSGTINTSIAFTTKMTIASTGYLTVQKSAGDGNVATFTNGTTGININCISTRISLENYDANQAFEIKTFGTGTLNFYTSGSSERFRVTSDGNILMGTTSNNGERLYVSGNIRATGSITANSDITLKKNLLKIKNALEKVEQINGYTYELKEDDSKRHGGVIAQEIDKVFPEIVNTGNDGLMGVEYGNISALLIEAIKEQNIKIKNLETLLASK
jgi:hypothetical protein